MLDWGDPNKIMFEQGLDRGVLYRNGQPPVPWVGITGFDEGGSGETSLLYRDGNVYLADADASDFGGKLTSYSYPDEFSACIGIPEATDGLYVDNQKPKRFSFAYRTLVGSGTDGDMFGYQIHLVYNCMATVGTRSRKTLNTGVDLVEFSFDVVCTPVRLPGFRPTAHYIIDTRNMGKSTVDELEALLYGTDETPGSLPEPSVLYDLMQFGSSITFTDHGDGTWSARGARANIEWTSPTTWVIRNVNGVDHGDGTYTLEDTP